MSDRDQPDDELRIRNPETLQRRAWIEHAIAAVRDRLQDGSLPRPPGRPAGDVERSAAERPSLTVIRGGRTEDQ